MTHEDGTVRRMRYPMIVTDEFQQQHAEWAQEMAQREFDKLARKEGLTAGPARLIRVIEPPTFLGIDHEFPTLPPLEPGQSARIFEADAY